MEFNYLVEKKRMCQSMQDDCIMGCVLFELMDENDNSCNQVEWDHPFEATEIVRKWAEERPKRKTRKDVLLETFPNAELKTEYGSYRICAKKMGLCKTCLVDQCEKCWNTEVAE